MNKKENKIETGSFVLGASIMLMAVVIYVVAIGWQKDKIAEKETINQIENKIVILENKTDEIDFKTRQLKIELVNMIKSKITHQKSVIDDEIGEMILDLLHTILEKETNDLDG